MQIVWLIDLHFQTVELYKTGALSVRLNREQEICDEPLLPGLTLPVARLARQRSKPFSKPHNARAARRALT